MKVTELNRDQLVCLKQAYLCELPQDWFADEPSYQDLANADSIVSDEEIFSHYAGTDFVPEDFPGIQEND
jgi:hypothetical protein